MKIETKSNRANLMTTPDPAARAISRKTFLIETIAGAAGVVGAGFALPRQASAAAPEKVATPSNGRPPLTAAIIGHTGRGDYGHGLDEIFQNRPDITLVAVADADAPGLARAVAKLKPARSYGDYREMLERERPRLVSVATRQADQHRDMMRAALAVGAHVYCEKPFTATPAEADELLATAKERGLKIAVAHQMRVTPVLVRLKAAVAGGLIGELLEMRGYGKQDGRAGGEDMIVLGTHIFDLMRLFAGDPQACAARVLWRGREITVADARRVKDDVGWLAGDQVMAEFFFARGVSGRFTSREALRESVGAWGLELIGSKGTVRINAGIPPRVFVLDSSGWRGEGRTDQWRPYGLDADRPREASAEFPTANARLVDNWLKAIAEGGEPAVSGRDAAWTVEMVMAVYRASLSGRRVDFPLAQREHPLAG
jgi:predicted dehydrogenase